MSDRRRMNTALESARLALAAARAAFRLVRDYYADLREDRRLGLAPTQPAGQVVMGAFAPAPGPAAGVHADSTGYEAASYRRLRAAAARLKLGPDDVFLDVGCGRGRAVFFMAAQGPRKAAGVEIRPDLVAQARANALTASRPPGTAIEIVEGDAAVLPAALLDEATVLFLFNPFGFRTLKSLVDDLRASLRRRPRRVVVVYLNAIHRWYLDDRPWLDEDAALDGEHRIMLWRSRPGYDYSAET